jgi:hypothetical protein
MNEIIEQLLVKGVIRFENDLYHINDGYYLIVNDEYYGDLFVMSAIFLDDDRLFVCDNTSQTYPINHIDDLTISKRI